MAKVASHWLVNFWAPRGWFWAAGRDRQTDKQEDREIGLGKGRKYIVAERQTTRVVGLSPSNHGKVSCDSFYLPTSLFI